MKEVKIFTDGGCSGNPGPGGWAYVMLVEGEETSNSGGEAATTNNRMELQAVISALNAVLAQIYAEKVKISVYTDSQYVKNGIKQWIKNWQRNGWKTASGQPVKNKDLWETLLALDQRLLVDWNWVKGHAGDKYNEICDSLVKLEFDKHR